MSNIPLYLFEDPGWRRFGPLTSNRPVWKLRMGRKTLEERINGMINATPSGYIPRKVLTSLVEEQIGRTDIDSLPSRGQILLVNGRAFANIPSQAMEKDFPPTLWTDGPDVVAVRIPVRIAEKWLFSGRIDDPADYSARTLLNIWAQEKRVPEVQIEEVPGSLIFWPWEMLNQHEALIRADFQAMRSGTINGDVHHKAILAEPGEIHIGEGSTVGAGAILDASEGPIIIEEDCKILPGAIIMGPVVLGRGCTVKSGAKLYGPLSIGPVCKLGGEIENSIILGYSNKQHEGFLGHALVGEWVNLGADTNNSDLKNNYSPVKIVLDGESISTGTTFFGSIIGDHVKTAINTQLNTGTVIGLGTVLFGEGFPPKTIGAFRWGGKAGFEMYDYKKFIQTASIVMERRKIELTNIQKNLIFELHQQAVEGKL